MFLIICAVKLVLSILDMSRPILQKEIIEYLQDGEPNSYDSVTKIALISVILCVTKIVQHTIWENLCYKMILTGHMAHGTLR